MKNISVFALAMLITGSIDSIRNLPATALFGSSLIFFFIFAGLLFLIPTALVSAELSATYKDQGGVFHWVRMAFGEKVGVLAIWLQWINTMVWYPTILSFIAGTLSYLINPALAHNKVYLVSVILIVFWAMTLINLRGIHVSAKFASICAVFGMIIPMALMIILAIIWLATGKPLALHLTAHDIIPNFSQGNSWISLTAIVTAFLGMELATVHVKQVKSSQTIFPKALFISVIIILVTMILGSLAIAYVIPASNIHLVDGVLETFSAFFAAYHLSWLLPIISIMLLVGSLGGMINWIISPAKGLLQAAQYGYLPKVLAKENKNGVAGIMLIIQAVLVSFVCLAFLLMPSVNGSYWLLTDLSTELYVLMYILVFLAAAWLRFKDSAHSSNFRIPGGKFGISFVCLAGLFACVVAFVIGFFPPDGVDVGGTRHYEFMFGGGLIMMITPIVLLYIYKCKDSCFKSIMA